MSRNEQSVNQRMQLILSREGKQFRESRVETPSHTGGVSEEALKREEERRSKGGRGLKVRTCDGDEH